jgi:Ca2+-binding EF-hand superfamily protein
MIRSYTAMDIARIIQERGAPVAHGLRGIRRELRAMDKNGTSLLERPEFEAGLRACGIQLSTMEMDEVFRHWDFNADLSVHFDEFLNAIRTPLSARRLLHVRKVFNTLDANNNNVAYLADIATAYNAAATPLCQNGVSESAVLEDFLEVLDSKKSSANGLITFAEFGDYYADVGNMMLEDGDFSRMIELEWGVNDSGLGSTEVPPAPHPQGTPRPSPSPHLADPRRILSCPVRQTCLPPPPLA